MSNHEEKIVTEYSKALGQKARSLVKSTGGARFADYDKADLSELPSNIAENSFGCGNPLAFSDVKQGQTVLDLGCGAGLDLLLAAQRVGVTGSVVGVDMTANMLQKAQLNVDQSGLKNIELKRGRIEDLPIDSNSVDWVISNCVINLSSQKDKAFSEIARVLRPEGRMLVSDIVIDNMPWWVRRSGLLTAACVGGAISETDYLLKLRAVGLVECKVVDRHFYEPSQLVLVVTENVPKAIKNLSCCGKNLFAPLLLKLAKSVARKVWSAKISAKAPVLEQVCDG